MPRCKAVIARGMGRGVPHPVDSVPQSPIHAQPDSLAIEYESARRADAVPPAGSEDPSYLPVDNQRIFAH